MLYSLRRIGNTVGIKYYNLGLKFSQQGNYHKAIEYLEKAVAISPQPIVYHHLGLVYGREGKNEEAEMCYKKALKMDPSLSKTNNNLGAIYLGKNDLQKAVMYFKRAIALDSSNFPAYNNLANTYRQMGEIKDATRFYLKAIKGNSDLPEPYNNLGRVYFEQGEFKKAVSCFVKAIKISPDYASAYSNLGNSQMKLGILNKAESSLKHHIMLDPNSAEGYYLLGSIYSLQSKYHEAMKNFKKAIAINPQYAPAYNDMGNLYKKTHNLIKAINSYQKSIEYEPGAAVSYYNLGITISHLGKFDLAMQHLKRAIEIDPNCAEAHYNLGNLYIKIESWDLAEKSFQNTLEINPQFGQASSLLAFVLLQQCNWQKYTKAAIKTNTIILKEIKDGLEISETPLLNIIRNENPKINFEVAKLWSKSVEKSVSGIYPKFNFAGRKNGKQLVVGYLSGDFYDHATAHLALGMFKLHDRKKFKIIGYSYGVSDGNYYLKQIERNCDKFVELENYGDIEATQKIYKDNVDILVDLKGYTEGSRLEICAFRPAPIQVTYLGFPGSTGSNFIDYLVTDKVITPPKSEKYYSEKLIFLHGSYQVNNDKQKISEKKFNRSDFGLPNEAFVFCSFNQPNKIEPCGFSVWMEILKAVPKSVLWLLKDNRFMEENLKKEANRLGIPSSRLIFSPFLPKDEHLKRMGLADLGLDTRIYNSHTTTSDALWAGVPMVTLQGKHFASRVSSSLLSAVGLPELITHSPKEYENLAIRLAEHPKELKTLKEKLNKNRLTKPLFDTKKFVTHLEKAYLKMWQIYCSGANPKSIEIK